MTRNLKWIFGEKWPQILGSAQIFRRFPTHLGAGSDIIDGKLIEGRDALGNFDDWLGAALAEWWFPDFLEPAIDGHRTTERPEPELN